MDVLPNVESNVTLGYTALMDVPPNLQFFFVTSTLRKHWVTLHLWDGVPPNVQFIVC